MGAAASSCNCCWARFRSALGIWRCRATFNDVLGAVRGAIWTPSWRPWCGWRRSGRAVPKAGRRRAGPSLTFEAAPTGSSRSNTPGSAPRIVFRSRPARRGDATGTILLPPAPACSARTSRSISKWIRSTGAGKWRLNAGRPGRRLLPPSRPKCVARRRHPKSVACRRQNRAGSPRSGRIVTAPATRRWCRS